MEDSVKVPGERIAALIGKDGQTKRQIEKLTKTKIDIDSDSGTIIVNGKGLDFYNALNIIKAIARGFSPEKAFLLANQDYYLDIIDIGETIGKNKKQVEVKKGRIIGREGKSREVIERATNCFISVYGKTVAIIGDAEGAQTAREAIQMLLEGARHQTVLDFFKRKEKQNELFEL